MMGPACSAPSESEEPVFAASFADTQCTVYRFDGTIPDDAYGAHGTPANKGDSRRISFGIDGLREKLGAPSWERTCSGMIDVSRRHDGDMCTGVLEFEFTQVFEPCFEAGECERLTLDGAAPAFNCPSAGTVALLDPVRAGYIVKDTLGDSARTSATRVAGLAFLGAKGLTAAYLELASPDGHTYAIVAETRD